MLDCLGDVAGAAVARGDVNDPTFAAPQPPQAFVRVDVSEDAVVDAWFCGERRFTDDAVLAATGDEETDAYLIAPVYDASTRRSTIVVLDCGADTVSYWVRHRRDALPSAQATSPRDPSASSPCPTKLHLSRGASTAPGAPQRTVLPAPPSMYEYPRHRAYMKKLTCCCITTSSRPPPRPPHAELVRREEVAHGPLYQ